MTLTLALLQAALQPLAPRWFDTARHWPDTQPAVWRTPAGRRAAPGSRPEGVDVRWPRSHHAGRSGSPAGRPPRLRVVHHAGAGRITISGRLSDVCEELDRLAAQEARRDRVSTGGRNLAPAAGSHPERAQR